MMTILGYWWSSTSAHLHAPVCITDTKWSPIYDSCIRICHLIQASRPLALKSGSCPFKRGAPAWLSPLRFTFGAPYGCILLSGREQWASRRQTGGGWGGPSESRLIVASPWRQVARWGGGGAWCASIFPRGRRDPKRQREDARACSCCIHPCIGSSFRCFSSCVNSA